MKEENRDVLLIAVVAFVAVVGIVAIMRLTSIPSIPYYDSTIGDNGIYAGQAVAIKPNLIDGDYVTVKPTTVRTTTLPVAPRTIDFVTSRTTSVPPTVKTTTRPTTISTTTRKTTTTVCTPVVLSTECLLGVSAYITSSRNSDCSIKYVTTYCPATQKCSQGRCVATTSTSSTRTTSTTRRTTTTIRLLPTTTTRRTTTSVCGWYVLGGKCSGNTLIETVQDFNCSVYTRPIDCGNRICQVDSCISPGNGTG